MKFIYKKISLYNRLEVLSALELPYIYKDDETVLRAYKKWGEVFLDKLNGDFAFALYDDAKNKYLLARDILGIKVLYYTKQNNKYYFSDDIDELTTLSGIKLVPDLASVESLLRSSEVDYEATMYREIHRVPPAHFLTIQENTIKLCRYWFPEKIQIDYDTPLEDTLEPFKALFEEAIKVRVDKHSQTAYELSGGLDSSSIVSMQKSLYVNEHIDTYSMSFKEMSCDENEYIKSVEEQYGFKTNSVEIATMDFKMEYDFEFNYKMSRHWPIVNTFTMYFPMANSMKKDNKKVIITGQGGDHLLEGHCDMIADLFLRRKFKNVYDEINALKKGRLAYFLRCTMWPLLGNRQKRFIKRMVFKVKSESSITIKDLFGLAEIRNKSHQFDIHALVSASQSTNLDANIFHVIEKEYGVEIRHPFYDKKLVEYVLSLPPEYKYSQGYIKILLRDAMKGILPEKIRRRPDKAEFSEVLRKQLDSIDLNALFFQSELVRLTLLGKDELKILVDGYYKHKNTVELWTVVNIEYWLQKTLNAPNEV